MALGLPKAIMPICYNWYIVAPFVICVKVTSSRQKPGDCEIYIASQKQNVILGYNNVCMYLL